MGNVYGYVRVSTKDQNEDRQLIALQEMSIPEKNIFEINNPARTSNVRCTNEC